MRAPPSARRWTGLTLSLAGLALCLLLPLGMLRGRAVAVDESEFVAATVRVRQGLVPYRDFWEHHLPLQWYAFSPWAELGDPPSVSDVVRLRTAQSVVWLAFAAAFVLLLRRRGGSLPASLAALALLASTVLFAAFAGEYRIDVPMNVLFTVGVLLAERSLDARAGAGRRAAFGAGVAWALAALCSQRMIPGALAALALYSFVRSEERWGPRPAFLGAWIGAGAVAASVAALFGAAGALEPLIDQNLLQNLWYERLAAADGAASPSPAWPLTLAFEISDLGLFVLLGVAATAPILSWRNAAGRAFSFRLLVLLGAQAVLLSRIRSPNPYQLGTALVLLALLAGLAVARAEERRPRLAIAAAAALALACSALAWNRTDFRIQSEMARFQDHVLSVVTRVAGPGESVLDGCGLAWHRRSAFDLWFLRPIALSLTRHGIHPALDGDRLLGERPAAIVADYAILAYLPHSPGLAATLVRNYFPLERSVWIPAPNARVGSGESAGWTVLRSGAYSLAADSRLEGHPWFRSPLAFPAMGASRPDAYALDLGLAGTDPALTLAVEGRPVADAARPLPLAAGQRVEVRNTGPVPLGVVLRPAGERIYFRDPFPSIPLWAAPEAQR